MHLACVHTTIRDLSADTSQINPNRFQRAPIEGYRLVGGWKGGSGGRRGLEGQGHSWAKSLKSDGARGAGLGDKGR